MKRPGRFIIYGAGAIGSVFGGMLALAGHRVSLVGREAHMQAVRERGLAIDGILGEHLVRDMEAVTSLDDVAAGPVEAVFLSVKSSDTAAAAADLAASGLVREDTLVISLQNGLGNLEILRGVFGPRRSVGGRVIFGAGIQEAGHVHVSVWADSVLLGGPGPGEGRSAVEEVARVLTLAGIDTKAVEDIQAALWGKVLYNAGLNPLSALLEVPYGELGREENARKLLEEVMTEAFEVASREVGLPWSSAGQYLEHFFGRLLPPTASHLSSMLQDLEKGRPTEIDAITGQILKRAEALGLPVPVNHVIYGLVKAKVARNRPPAEGTL